jgi:hypothetical protein
MRRRICIRGGRRRRGGLEGGGGGVERCKRTEPGGDGRDDGFFLGEAEEDEVGEGSEVGGVGEVLLVEPLVVDLGEEAISYKEKEALGA